LEYYFKSLRHIFDITIRLQNVYSRWERLRGISACICQAEWLRALLNAYKACDGSVLIEYVQKAHSCFVWLTICLESVQPLFIIKSVQKVLCSNEVCLEHVSRMASFIKYTCLESVQSFVLNGMPWRRTLITHIS